MRKGWDCHWIIRYEFTTFSKVMDADKWDQLYELVKITDKETPDKEDIERNISREDFDFYFTNSKTTSPETMFIATY
jgi:hypothetical protein